MKKTGYKVVSIGCAGALVLVLGGCGSAAPVEGSSDQQAAQEQEQRQPLDLSGNWGQTNKNSEDSYHIATISGDVITVDWVTNGGDTKSIYWVGTYAAPIEATDSYSWDSSRDEAATKGSMLASGDDMKTFSYSDGVLSYEFTAMGTTTTVKMERI